MNHIWHLLYLLEKIKLSYCQPAFKQGKRVSPLHCPISAHVDGRPPFLHQMSAVTCLYWTSDVREGRPAKLKVRSPLTQKAEDLSRESVCGRGWGPCWPRIETENLLKYFLKWCEKTRWTFTECLIFFRFQCVCMEGWIRGWLLVVHRPLCQPGRLAAQHGTDQWWLVNMGLGGSNWK